MKKITKAVFLFSFLAGALFANDLDDRNIKGKVSIEKYETYPLVQKFGEWVQGPRESIYIYTYDNNGNVIESLSETPYFTQNRQTRLTHKLDEAGNITEESYYDQGGALIQKEIYSYDKNGNRTEETCYGSDGAMVWKYLFTYDEKGNCTEETWFNPDGTLDMKFIYSYDDKGNKTAYYYDSKGTLTGKQLEFYDTKGQTIERSDFSSDGKLEDKFIYSYDDKGNCTEALRYSPNGTPTGRFIHAYEYDKTGNWIKQINSEEVYKFGKTYIEPKSQYIRSITYYDEVKK